MSKWKCADNLFPSDFVIRRTSELLRTIIIITRVSHYCTSRRIDSFPCLNVFTFSLPPSVCAFLANQRENQTNEIISPVSSKQTTRCVRPSLTQIDINRRKSQQRRWTMNRFRCSKLVLMVKDKSKRPFVKLCDRESSRNEPGFPHAMPIRYTYRRSWMELVEISDCAIVQCCLSLSRDN